MIVCSIIDASRYGALSPNLAEAIGWLIDHCADDFAKGKYSIAGSGNAEIFAKCEEPALLPREKAALESHRRYIDIHVPLKGTEIIGWAPVEALKHIRTPYDADADIAFYGDAAHSLLHVKRGQCAIFFPEDAHAPNIGLGSHRKLCIKIPV
ncbi:MAG: YhcH/YjgK/YiaL family protein [Muribaculaceae bacterium]|nr:YhcH/YjgK/YiaL family protein [Muribaculaceae bacterium]